MKQIIISEELYKKISSFGHKDETYNDILERLYNTATEAQFAQHLMSTQNAIDINDLPW